MNEVVSADMPTFYTSDLSPDCNFLKKVVCMCTRAFCLMKCVMVKALWCKVPAYVVCSSPALNRCIGVARLAFQLCCNVFVSYEGVI